MYRHGGSWRETYVDATDTKQKLRALAAVGVTSRRIAAHMSVSVDMVSYLRRTRGKRVSPALAAAVDDAYAALWLRGRTDANARRCSTQARTLGYDPDPHGDDIVEPIEPVEPIELLDEIAIGEACRGRRVRLTLAERAEAIRRLDAAGHTADDIATRLGIASRTVVRHRKAA